MYSRYTSAHDDKKYQVPEHYSGCAFAPPRKEDTRRGAEPFRPAPLPKAKISPQHAPSPSYSSPPQQSSPAMPPQKESPTPPAEQLPPTEATQEASTAQMEAKEKKESALPQSLGQLLSHIGIGLPFSRGIDFDSLLLLGLILLLAGDGGDRELLLLLTLLLFCA